MVKCEVLEQGEEALIFKYGGHVKFVQGPKRIWLYLSSLTRLKKFTAQHDEYLSIKFTDGHVEHVQGPCTRTLNTLLYTDINVQKCFCISANQAIIVYQKLKDQDYSRKTISGPGIFMTHPDEWVHKFSWHGEDPKKQNGIHSQYQQLCYPQFCARSNLLQCESSSNI